MYAELLADIVRWEWTITASIGVYYAMLKVVRTKRRITVGRSLPTASLPTIQLSRDLVETVLRGNLRKAYYFAAVHMAFLLAGVAVLFLPRVWAAIITGVVFPLAQALLVADLVQTRREEFHVLEQNHRIEQRSRLVSGIVKQQAETIKEQRHGLTDYGTVESDQAESE